MKISKTLVTFCLFLHINDKKPHSYNQTEFNEWNVWLDTLMYKKNPAQYTEWKMCVCVCVTHLRESEVPYVAVWCCSLKTGMPSKWSITRLMHTLFHKYPVCTKVAGTLNLFFSFWCVWSIKPGEGFSRVCNKLWFDRPNISLNTGEHSPNGPLWTLSSLWSFVCVCVFTANRCVTIVRILLSSQNRT